MSLIDKSGIVSGSIIFPEHVLRTIEALRGEESHDFIMSGSSLNVLSSNIKFPLINELPNPNALIAYNTSSGNIYYSTGGFENLVGPQGPTGPQGPIGPQGATGIDGILDVTAITTDDTFFPIFVSGVGAQTPNIRTASIGFNYNPSTGSLELGGSAGRILTGTGSATSPSHTFTGDDNTGMYLQQTGTLSFSTNGVERIVIDNIKTQFLTQLIQINQSKVSTSNRTNISGTETFDAGAIGMGRWVASFTGTITAQISNLTEGRSFFLYVSNLNVTAREINIEVSGTTSGYVVPLLSLGGGGYPVSSVSLVGSVKGIGGTTTIWVANIGGNFIGAIY